MLRPFVFGLVAAAMVAGSAMAAEGGKRKSGDPNKMICKTESEIGSKLRRTRACHTKAEWEELRRQTRANVERIENARVCNCGS
ncbi:MAG TPA: hypothetical protein VIT45_12415 [Allosphingosinicella sp.]